MWKFKRFVLISLIKKHRPFTLYGVSPELAKIVEDKIYSRDYLDTFLDHVQGEFEDAAWDELVLCGGKRGKK